MGRYAENSKVPVDRSKAEIERLLMRYGADQFLRGSSLAPRCEMIAFRMQGRNVKLHLPMPDPGDELFRLTPTGMERSESVVRAEWEKEVRRRWRVFILLIKTQLEAIELGIMDLDEAFFANIVVPGGRRLVDEMRPQLAQAYQSGKIGNLLEFKG